MGIWLRPPSLPLRTELEINGLEGQIIARTWQGGIAQVSVTAPCAGDIPYSSVISAWHTIVSAHVSCLCQETHHLAKKEGQVQKQKLLAVTESKEAQPNNSQMEQSTCREAWQQKKMLKRRPPREEKNGIMHVTFGSDTCQKPHFEGESIQGVSKCQLSKHCRWSRASTPEGSSISLSLPICTASQMLH